MERFVRLSLVLALSGLLLFAGAPVYAESSDKPGFHGWGDDAGPEMKKENADHDSQAGEPETAGDAEASGEAAEESFYERYDRERAAFREETRDLRQQIYNKVRRLREELAKENPDRDTALSLQKEISGLRAEFDRKRLEYAIRMKSLEREAGGSGSGRYGYRGGYCPNCPYADDERDEQSGYGKGRGYGMGPGMMGPGYGRGHGMMRRGWGDERGYYGGDDSRRYPQSSGPVDEQTAREIVESYLQSTRNPNLRLGEIKDVGRGYEAEIVTKDNSPVDRLFVDKDSGMVSSVY